MVKEVQVAAFEGGSLRLLSSGAKGREAVLALPLNRLLVELVRVPAGTDPVECATPILQARNPFPDEPLTISCEVVRETADGVVVIAAALPEGATDDLAEALDQHRLHITRVDALAFGVLRGLWSAFDASAGRRLIVLRSVDCLTLMVLDGDQHSAIRAIADEEDFRRELMLLLLQAESFGGVQPLKEILVVESEGVELTSGARAVLAEFASVRDVRIGADAALVGVAERSADASTLNALPAGWQDELETVRFKTKMRTYLIAAGAGWLALMGVLFGVPIAYGYLTDHQKALSKGHAPKYRAVQTTIDKLNIVRKYSDRSRSALELMRAVSDRVPEDVTLTSWNFTADKGLHFSAEAGSQNGALLLKEEMEALKFDGEEGEPVFESVKQGTISSVKDKLKFDIDLLFTAEEEE